MRKGGLWVIGVAVASLAPIAARDAVAQALRTGGVEVVTASEGGRALGFDVRVGGKLLAPVRLSSNRLVTAGKVETTQTGRSRALRFNQLEAKAGTGLTLDADDFVLVELEGADPFPKVSFRLTIKAFNPGTWQVGAGKFPFHFLTCSMLGAEVWHQRGWLMATPRADPFPLLLDVHVGSPEVASQWSRNWSYSCPVGAHPIPVIGLWAPQEKLYVGYDFQEARLTDHSEKYVGTAYCWKEGVDNQFIALTYPYGGALYQQLKFPNAGEVVNSHFRLLYSTDLDSTKDPNLFWQDLLFERHADQLPRVPRMNDMSWMPGGTRLADFYSPGSPQLVARTGQGGTFAEPGTVEIGGWVWHRESPVEAAYERQKRAKQLAESGDYVPLLSIVDAEGRSYGDAAVALRLNFGEGKGGRLLYVWYGVLGRPETGQTVIREALQYLWRTSGLDKLPEAGRWRKVAILPPEVTGPVADFLRGAGLLDRMAMLTPEQLVDEKTLSPSNFPVALDLGAESYIKSVKASGDGKRAILNYLRGGGLIACLGRGPYPMYAGIEGEKRTPDPLFPALEVPVYMFEEPPTQLFVVANKAQKALDLGTLPDRFDFPTPIEPRLRSITRGEDSLARLRADLDYLLPKAKRVTVGGEECLFWEKPVEGKWWDNWGGEPVRTLHNTNGWAAGMALVDLYRHERDVKLLPYIDGVYNWTKHFVWTRNEFADVPSSPFAIGGTLSTAFLLDYHFTFLNDPQRAANAKAAPELARVILYRYMPVWTTDNDEDDNLDPHFLFEPNSGRDWAGLACANEVHWVLDSMTQVFVHTGDRRLAYYLRGALERWYQLYRDRYGRSLLDYAGDSLSEGLGFFEDCGPGRGGHYDFGAADVLPLNWPVGDSLIRIVCGEKAAFACNKEGAHTEIADYRCTMGGEGVVGFSFRLKSSLNRPFDISLSFPFVNIAGMAVTIGQTAGAGVPASPVTYPPQSPSSMYVRGLRDSDVVTVGRVDTQAPTLPVDSGFEYQQPKPEERTEGAFEMLSFALDTKVAFDWSDTASFAGLLPGKRYAFKVPYTLAAPEVTGRAVATTRRVEFKPQVEGASHVFAVYAASGAQPAVTFSLDDGSTVPAEASNAALAWRAWPPIFQQRLWLTSSAVPAGRKVAAAEPHDAMLFAVTAWRGTPQQFEPVQACVAKAVAEARRVREEEARIAGLRKKLEGVPWEKVALVPPEVGGKAAAWVGRLGLLARMARLSRRDFVNPEAFNPKRFPVALYLGQETYTRTVAREGDGRQALVGYLKGGGLLVCLAGGPFPMFYADGTGAENAKPLLPELGVPLGVTFERPPADMTIVTNRQQKTINLETLPGRFPFPKEGDQRLRSIDPAKVSAATKYVPLLTVQDAEGKSYGDAAAYLELGDGEAAGGKVLYVWSRMLDNMETGTKVLECVFARFLSAVLAP